MKPRRDQIAEHFSEEIERLYEWETGRRRQRFA
jgi:hypothetical protein